MAYFVKVIPPSKRARIHLGTCRHYRDGLGQVNQDMKRDENGKPEGGATYWSDPFDTISKAKKFMESLSYPKDTGTCSTCLSGI